MKDLVTTDQSSELDAFTNLKSSDKNVRVNAACTILQNIIRSKETSEHAVYLNVKRLIRGLGGSKIHFKQGCYASVVGFFSLLPVEFDFNALEEIILQELMPGGNSSKQDEGEAFFGQILAYGAMIDASYLISQPKSTQKHVFMKIFDLSSKRSYLHNVAFSFLILFVKKIGREFFNDDIIKHLSNLDTDSLDKLNYLLAVSEFSKKKITVKSALNTNTLLVRENIPTIITQLKSHIGDKDSKHDFYNNFIKSSINYPDFFYSFWHSLCEEAERNKNSKMEVQESNSAIKLLKKCDKLILHLSNILFSQLLENPTTDFIQEIFNETFISVILRNKFWAAETISSILNNCCTLVVSAPDSLKLNILNKIFFDMKCFKFNQLTATKFTLKVINGLSFESVKNLVEEIKSNLEDDNVNKMPWLMLLKSLLFHENTFNGTIWRTEQFSYLFQLGFSANSSSNHFRDTVKKILFDFLGSRFRNMEALDEVLNIIICDLKKLVKTNNCCVQLNEEMTQSFTDAIALWKILKIAVKTDTDKKLVLAFKIILGYSTLLLLSEVETAINNIQDMKRIYAELNSKSDQSDIEIQWIEVLIDLILNLLSRPNYRHRHIVNSVFKAICPHLTHRAFSQIIEVLDPSYVGLTSEEDEGSDVENEEDEGSDDENEEDDGSDDENEEDSESSKDEDEESDDDLTTNEKLRQELRSVLTGNVSDVESVDLDEMDEEEGKQLDAKLSEIFKANLKLKETKKEKKYNVDLSDFKMRVLDLVEVCSEVTLPFSYWLKAVKPLTELLSSVISNKKVSSMQSRISHVIFKLSKAKVLVDISAEECSSILGELLQKVTLTSGLYPDMRLQLGSLIKFILKSTKSLLGDLKPNALKRNPLFETVQSAFKNYFNSRGGQGSIFLLITANCWDGIYPLIPLIIEWTFCTQVKLNKRIEGLKIIIEFFKNPYYFRENREKYEDKFIIKAKTSLQQNILNLDPQNQGNLQFFPHLCSAIYNLLNLKNQDRLQLLETDKLKDIISQHLKILPKLKGKRQNLLYKLCKLLSIPVDKIKSCQGNGTLASPESEEQVEQIGKRTIAETEKTKNKRKCKREETAESTLKLNPKTSKKNKSNILKKKSKNLRLSAMNDGLEECSFLNSIVNSDLEE